MCTKAKTSYIYDRREYTWSDMCFFLLYLLVSLLNGDASQTREHNESVKQTELYIDHESMSAHFIVQPAQTANSINLKIGNVHD